MGAYCPSTGVVEASARSDSVILPLAIQLSGTRSIMNRVFFGVKAAVLDRNWKSVVGLVAGGIFPEGFRSTIGLLTPIL